MRFVAQHHDVATGKIFDVSILENTALSKVTTLKELGYLHVEQIDFLKKIQDFKIKHQIVLSNLSSEFCSSERSRAFVSRAI